MLSVAAASVLLFFVALILPLKLGLVLTVLSALGLMWFAQLIHPDDWLGSMAVAGFLMLVAPFVLGVMVRLLGVLLRKVSLRVECGFYIFCSLIFIGPVAYGTYLKVRPLPASCQIDQVEVQLVGRTFNLPSSIPIHFYFQEKKTHISFKSPGDLRALCWRNAPDLPIPVDYFDIDFDRFETAHLPPRRIRANYRRACPQISGYSWGREICTSQQLPSELGYPKEVWFSSEDAPMTRYADIEETISSAKERGNAVTLDNIDGFRRVQTKFEGNVAKDEWISLPGAWPSDQMVRLSCRNWPENPRIRCDARIELPNDIHVRYDIEGEPEEIPKIARKAYAKVTSVLLEMSM